MEDDIKSTNGDNDIWKIIVSQLMAIMAMEDDNKSTNGDNDIWKMIISQLIVTIIFGR
jgi:hypothetical protein